ncbi:50S ribosomal protein L34e [Candidatus Woesearchaeota archaeon]|nr:50S ribosomal protein L34e [Candidatus Woesearchaeota archaeon]
MPSPKHRSSKLRKIFVRTASKINVHYRKTKPGKARCPECGCVLKGVINARATKLKGISKTKKIPSRKFANLCSQCSRKKLIGMARGIKW